MTLTDEQCAAISKELRDRIGVKVTFNCDSALIRAGHAAARASAQEPVAWWYQCNDSVVTCHERVTNRYAGWTETPLYAAPPAAPVEPPAPDAELIEAMGNWCKSFAHNAPLRRVLECAADRIAALTAELDKQRRRKEHYKRILRETEDERDAQSRWRQQIAGVAEAAERELAQAMRVVEAADRLRKCAGDLPMTRTHILESGLLPRLTDYDTARADAEGKA